MMQQTIFACEPPGIAYPLSEEGRVGLAGGAWIQYAPRWIAGHDALYQELELTVRWDTHRRRMYDRVVDVPRLTGSPPGAGFAAVFLEELSLALSAHFGRPLTRVSLAWYRDGRDSVAMHGDKVGRLAADCIVAIVAVGAPRRFLLREVSGPGALRFELGWGDLLVMGGRCQQTWRHGVPKTARADPRISIQFRPEIP